MKSETEKPSIIASIFRANYTVFQLERIQRVTGQTFPISGDLWLTEGNGSRIEWK